MHVCFLCNEYPPSPHGGVGSFTQTLARALTARGHDTTVVGVYRSAEPARDTDQGVNVVRLPATQVPKAGFIVNGRRLRQALRQIHREKPIDILEGPEASLAAVPRNFPAAKVIRMHGGHHFFSVTLGNKPRPWRSWLERRSFGRADFLCAVSQFVGDSTRDLLQLGDRPIEVIPNPIDVTQFRARTPASETDGLILYVGAVCEKKGIRQLVEAMPSITQAVPHAVLWVVGRDSQDPHSGQSFIANLRQRIPPSIQDKVVFRGAVERAMIPDLLSRAAVCVYPSHMEALPIAWLEGLAMGKAVVASRTGPGPEVVEDGTSGLLCDPHDPASIAQSVIALLQDARRRHQLGRQALQRVLDRFSLEVLIERNETFYRQCRS
jgi:glycosyltransferase involved in cell wall biosynthesis